MYRYKIRSITFNQYFIQSISCVLLWCYRGTVTTYLIKYEEETKSVMERLQFTTRRDAVAY